MFTGIIETIGNIEEIIIDGSNHSFWVKSSISETFKIDQSVAHDGVCLTVDALEPGRHRVTAIAQTLAVTALKNWHTGSLVNIETCMQLNGKLDGHIVQGHVDAVATCQEVTDKKGSWVYRFSFPVEFANNIVEKGSICINGTSLTLFDIGKDYFFVAIIPYTFEHTNFKHIQVGSSVNIEFDILGKYINRIIDLQK